VSVGCCEILATAGSNRAWSQARVLTCSSVCTRAAGGFLKFHCSRTVLRTGALRRRSRGKCILQHTRRTDAAPSGIVAYRLSLAGHILARACVQVHDCRSFGGDPTAGHQCLHSTAPALWHGIQLDGIVRPENGGTSARHDDAQQRAAHRKKKRGKINVHAQTQGQSQTLKIQYLTRRSVRRRVSTPCGQRQRAKPS